MAKPSITDARSITARFHPRGWQVLQRSAIAQLASQLSGTAREIRALTSGCHLPGRIGAQLSVEQIQLLQDGRS